MQLFQVIPIVGFCIFAAVVYGVVHDQITARICIEYFTIGHPPLIQSDDPTWIGLFWGVVATWWVGLGLGLMLALACVVGGWPVLRASQIAKPVMVMLVGVGIFAAVMGTAGYYCAKNGWVILLEPMASSVPVETHHRFLAVFWTHLASYGGGLVGGIGLCVWVLFKRRRFYVGNGTLTRGTAL